MAKGEIVRHAQTIYILAPTAYKVHMGALCELLKPLVKTAIGSHQCDFRSDKFTIDHIFTLRQILEKTHEKS